ncbi:MAG: dimethylmenaquinone methyltransferase [Acidobacteria bacterium]|nr:dimethylmenaquinone methyltransferase [Acidobacteriota bacterium]
MMLLASSDVLGQINNLSREEMIRYTAQNPYDRFPDGRPKVPDSVLEQLKDMSAEEFIGAGGRGSNQFVDGFQLLSPGKKLIGRAFTLQLMPIRAEVADADAAAWKEKGNTLPLNHQTALDMLQPGDVFVVDAFGNLDAGGIVGDNLAYYVWKKTGAGFVIDGAIRDLEGIAAFGMAGYFRGAVPPAIRGLMVTGINVPIRIGKTTVMPGDVVFGDREGVTFVPPHQVQGFIDTARITHIHDEWTKIKFAEGKYKSTDIYGRPHDPALIQEYEEYLKQKLGAQAYEEYKKRGGGPRPSAPAKPQR